MVRGCFWIMKPYKDIGFDSRELEWFLECEGKTIDDFLEWVKR